MPNDVPRRALAGACVILALSALIVFGLSCGSSSPTGGDDEDFSFKVTVVDTRGREVEGLLVGVWNDYDVGDYEYDRCEDSRFVTQIAFGVEEEADVLLEVYDLDGQLLRTLADETAAPGVYSKGFYGSSWDVPSGTRVFEMQFVAREPDSRAILYRDSVYAVYWDGYNEESCVIGATSAQGTFETDDVLLFPHLLDLPAIQATNPFGDPVGNVVLSDSVFIAVGDTTSGQNQWVRESHTVVDGANSITIVWDPDRATPAPVSPDAAAAEGVPTADVGLSHSWRYEWWLSQNYPNPFN
jgi:hypothetical protein